MIVKICGITNSGDAAIAIAAGATALGFNFYPRSPRFISFAAARAIAAEVPAGILKVGIFVNETPERVCEAVPEAGIDVAQVIGPPPASARYWRVHRPVPGFCSNDLDDSRAEAFLLDTPSDSLHGGTGHTFDWLLASIPGKRIVIAGGLGPDNVAQAIRACRPWGVDACSRLESTPGRKDPDKVKAFVAAALSV